MGNLSRDSIPCADGGYCKPKSVQQILRTVYNGTGPTLKDRGLSPAAAVVAGTAAFLAAAQGLTYLSSRLPSRYSVRSPPSPSIDKFWRLRFLLPSHGQPQGAEGSDSRKSRWTEDARRASPIFWSDGCQSPPRRSAGRISSLSLSLREIARHSRSGEADRAQLGFFFQGPQIGRSLTWGVKGYCIVLRNAQI